MKTRSATNTHSAASSMSQRAPSQQRETMPPDGEEEPKVVMIRNTLYIGHNPIHMKAKMIRLDVGAIATIANVQAIFYKGPHGAQPSQYHTDLLTAVARIKCKKFSFKNEAAVPSLNSATVAALASAQCENMIIKNQAISIENIKILARQKFNGIYVPNVTTSLLNWIANKSKHSSTTYMSTGIDFLVLTDFLTKHFGNFDAERFHLNPRDGVIVKEMPTRDNNKQGQALVRNDGLLVILYEINNEEEQPSKKYDLVCVGRL